LGADSSITATVRRENLLDRLGCILLVVTNRLDVEARAPSRAQCQTLNILRRSKV
jgi:hypothetical protein